jgi:uncharacterized membrane protein AbrB (regulator of aidB expression)
MTAPLAGKTRVLTLAATYVAAGLGGFVAFWLDIPLPWMVGAMLVASAITLAADTAPPPRLSRVAGQIIIGASVGLNLTPDALQSIIASAVPIAVSALLTIAAGTLIGLAQARRSRAVPRKWRSRRRAMAVQAAPWPSLRPSG